MSHRHHSHLGAIYPFCTVDPNDPTHEALIRNTIDHWVSRGAGAWTGWCVPWALILCSRCNLSDAALTWLHWWKDVFTNAGHGTLHNAHYPGASVFGGMRSLAEHGDGRNREIMQIEAGMGAITAIVELLVQCGATQLLCYRASRHAGRS